MDSVNLINLNNENVNATVIRYFELNSNKYFIYSLNEIDAQNYVKLYVTKIGLSNGQIISSNITDEGEWNLIKEEIKNIVRDNKSGVAEVTDLDFNELNSLQVKESRAFKLSNQLVLLLSANKQVKEEIVEQSFGIDPIVSEKDEVAVDTPTFNVEANSIEPQNIGPTADFDINPQLENQSNEVAVDNFKELYEKELEKNQQLNMELEQLKAKIDEIKNILNS